MTNQLRIIVTLLLLAITALLAPSYTLQAYADSAAPAVQLTLDARADAWVNEDQPSTNYGAATSLNVGRDLDRDDNAFEMIALATFDLADLPPGAQIQSATLRLYQTGADGASTYWVYPRAITGSWSQNSVTWNTLPATVAAGSGATINTSGGWKTWDVTDIVEGWVQGALANYGISLNGGADAIGVRTFEAREAGSRPPQLIIDYTLPQPTNTPTPTQTATPRPTNTPTPRPTNTPTPRPTNTPTPRPTNTPSPTPRPTNTPTPRPTNTPTSRPTETPTSRPTNTPTSVTRTPSPTPTSTVSRPTNTPTSVTRTPTPTPTSTLLRPTNTPTSTPRTPTNTPTSQVPTSPTPTPTITPRTSTTTPTPSPTPTSTTAIVRAPVVLADDIALGGVLRVSGYNYTPSQTVQVHIDNTQQSALLGSLTANRAGELPPTDFAWPGGFFAGAYSVVTIDNGGVRLAADAFNVAPAPLVRVIPGEGAPGDVVTIAVSGLLPGDLRIDYAGGAVLGPLPVSASSFTDDFIVPGDRPVPLGSVTTVVASVFRGDQLIAKGQSPFLSQSPSSFPTYEIENLMSSTRDLAPGRAFSLQGTISPAPAGPLDDLTILAVWEDSEGQLYQLPGARINPNRDGSFELSAYAPSILRGDPFSARSGQRFGVQLITPQQTLTETGIETLWDQFNTFKVQVVKDMTGTPFSQYHGDGVPNIPAGALQVAFDPLYVLTAPASDLVDLSQATPLLKMDLIYGTIFENNANLLHDLLVKKLDMCLYHHETASIPWWEWVMTPEETVILTGDQVIDPPDLQLNLAVPDQARSMSATAEEELTVQVIRVYVDASDVIDIQGGLWGYGRTNVDGEILIHIKDYAYIVELDLAYPLQINGGGMTITPVANPVAIALPPLPQDAVFIPSVKAVRLVPFGSEGPFDETSGVGHKTIDPQTGALVFGDFYSFAGMPPGTAFNNEEPMDILVFPNIDVGNAFNHIEATLEWQGQSIELSPDFSEPPSCYGALVKSYTHLQGTLPSMSHLPPGEHEMLLQFAGGEQDTEPLPLVFDFKPNPQNDPEIQPLTGRTWWWHIYGATLSATALKPGTAKSDSSGNLGDIGNKNNNVNLGSQVVWLKDMEGTWWKGPQKGTMNSKAVDKTAAPLEFPVKSGSLQAASASAPQFMPDVDQTVTILDTGWITVFKAAYGIPLVATIGLGVDFAVTAVAGIKTLPSEVTVYFNGEVKVDVYLSAEIGGGVIADGTVGVESTIGVLVPTTYKLDGSKVDVGECFHYKAILHYEINVFFRLVEVASGEEELFSGSTGKGCPKTLMRMAGPASTPRPSHMPALATDGFGHTTAVWRSAEYDILASHFDGVAWSPAQTVVANGKSQSPVIAYFARDRAIAVWSQNGLEAPLPPGVTLTELLRNQHLVYALWDGGSGQWSPPQPLTLPTTGDGVVSLAACPAANIRCPAGGAVAAAWVHDAAGDVSQRQFRIHGAVFANGAWTHYAVDGASAGSDTMPDVAWVDGVAVVAWVHDADRDVNTVGDRKLRMRVLGGASPIVEPGAFPGGVIGPDLVGDANGGLHLAFTLAETEGLPVSSRQPLYYAYSACDACLQNDAASNASTLPSSAPLSPASAAVEGRDWAVRRIQDPLGRTIFAESPVVTLDQDDRPTITYRALGFDEIAPGGEAVLEVKEPLGVMARTGEMAQIEIEAGRVTSPRYLTGDGAVNWQTAAVFDPALNRTIAVAVKGAPPSSTDTTRLLSAQSFDATRSLAGEPALTFASVGRGPNFVVRKVRASQPYFAGENTVTATIEVQNTGSSWQAGEGAGVEVVASWDGRAGQGAQAARTSIASLAAGASQTLTLALAPPPTALEGEHTLNVAINPGQQIAEQLLFDNEFSLEIGRLPAPTGLFATPSDDDSLLFLNWDAVADERVTGYRIYRLDANGERTQVGSSSVAGWVDTTYTAGEARQYAVAAHTAGLLESSPSQTLDVNFLQPGGPHVTFTPLIQR